MTDNKTIQTQLIHAPRKAPQYIVSIQPPLFRASTIIFPSTADLFDRHWTDAYDYSYGTHGTPTTYTLADQLAQLEGGHIAYSHRVDYLPLIWLIQPF